MSCEKCDTEPLRGAYLRWKNANVEMVDCKEHWLEIRNALSNTPEEQDEQEKS